VTGAALAEEEPEDEPDVDEPDESDPLDEDPPASVLGESEGWAAAAAAFACAAARAFARAAAARFAAAAWFAAAVEACDVAPVPLAVVVCLVAPSAGSCPVTKRPKIATQAARKSESVIAITRRRMVRARRLRARTRWRARARPS
jgi:hypothetical protein